MGDQHYPTHRKILKVTAVTDLFQGSTAWGPREPEARSLPPQKLVKGLKARFEL